ncbi:Ferrienterobactin receptor [compost metagenome]
MNLGLAWDVTDTAKLSAGVNNVFNKQLFRTGQGANTFNEPGRAFYVSLNKTF